MQRQGNVRVSKTIRFTRQERAKGVEQISLPRGGLFLRQAGHDVFQKGAGPTTLKDPVWREFVFSFELVKRLGRAVVQGNHRTSAAALLRLSPIPVVGEEVLQ